MANENEEEGLLDSVDLNDLDPNDEGVLRPPSGKLKKIEEDNEPLMTDAGWTAYVMSYFENNEVDKDGNPRVHGLRRVASLLLGPILVSRAKVIQAPTYAGGERGTMLTPAVVEHTIRILMCHAGEGRPPYEAEYTEAADVYFGNTDLEYARHATATASTKAEARALRKLLHLNTVSAEEVTRVPLAEASVTGEISPTQINFLQILCQRNDINLMRFINSGKGKYESVKDVPGAQALKMVQFLSECQRDKSKVKPEWKGWEE